MRTYNKYVRICGSSHIGTYLISMYIFVANWYILTIFGKYVHQYSLQIGTYLPYLVSMYIFVIKWHIFDKYVATYSINICT